MLQEVAVLGMRFGFASTNKDGLLVRTENRLFEGSGRIQIIGTFGGNCWMQAKPGKKGLNLVLEVKSWEEHGGVLCLEKLGASEVVVLWPFFEES